MRCGSLDGICSATGRPHARARGKVARDAAKYPFDLCRAILEGFSEELDKRGLHALGELSFLSVGEKDKVDV